MLFPFRPHPNIYALPQSNFILSVRKNNEKLREKSILFDGRRCAKGSDGHRVMNIDGKRMSWHDFIDSPRRVREIKIDIGTTSHGRKLNATDIYVGSFYG